MQDALRPTQGRRGMVARRDMRATIRLWPACRTWDRRAIAAADRPVSDNGLIVRGMPRDAGANHLAARPDRP